MTSVLPDLYPFLISSCSTSQWHLTKFVTSSCFSSYLLLLVLGFSFSWPQSVGLGHSLVPGSVLNYLVLHPETLRDISLDVILGSVKTFISLDELVSFCAFKYNLQVVGFQLLLWWLFWTWTRISSCLFHIYTLVPKLVLGFNPKLISTIHLVS